MECNKDLRALLKEWKNPPPSERKQTSSTRKPKIEVTCKKYRLLFPGYLNRPKKRATRRRVSKSKSKTPVPSTSSENEHVFAVPTSPVLPISSVKAEKPSRNKFSKRKRPEVLGTLNFNNNGANQSEFVKMIGKEQRIEVGNQKILRPKRKRLVDDSSEMSAENIPVESLFSVQPFGINQDISPQKRRRLQSLISPTLMSLQFTSSSTSFGEGQEETNKFP